MKKVFLILGALSISGCAKTVNEMNYAEIHELAGQINARCAAQAGRPGSPEFQTCTQIEARNEVYKRQQARADAAAFAAGMAEGMTAASASYSAGAAAAAAARPVAPAYRAPVYCSGQTVGPTTQMVCN